MKEITIPRADLKKIARLLYRADKTEQYSEEVERYIVSGGYCVTLDEKTPDMATISYSEKMVNRKGDNR